MTHQTKTLRDSTFKWRLAILARSLCLSVGVSALLAQSSTQEAQMHYKVAQVALKNNDITVAVEELFKSAELAPQNALVHYYLAVALKEQRKATEGLEHLRIAMQLGLPIKENATANDLFAELTYAAKLQPLTDLIGDWIQTETVDRKSKDCTFTTTDSRRLAVPSQNLQNGVLKAEFTYSYRSSTVDGCSFKSTGTKLLSNETRRNGNISLAGDQLRLHFDKGLCTGDCLEADIDPLGYVLENVSRDELTFQNTSNVDRFVLTNQSPTPAYLARRNAEAETALKNESAQVLKTLNSFAGNWSSSKPSETNKWGSGCKSETEWGEKMFFGRIGAGDLQARGSEEVRYDRDIVIDPRGKCTFENGLTEANYRQRGSVVLTCNKEDSCQVLITYSPCTGGERCTDHTRSPGQHKCSVALSEMSERSFTLRCETDFVRVFQRQ